MIGYSYLKLAKKSLLSEKFADRHHIFSIQALIGMTTSIKVAGIKRGLIRKVFILSKQAVKSSYLIEDYLDLKA